MNLQATQLSFFFEAISSLLRPKKKIISQASPTSSNDLRIIWHKLVYKYFPNQSNLLNYKIVWSNRPQKRVLASCNIEKRIVRVAPAMRLDESRPYLEALIYHELCHAVVGIGYKNGRRDIHSKNFKQLESLHPEIKNLDQWIKEGGWIKAVRISTRAINRQKLLGNSR